MTSPLSSRLALFEMTTVSGETVVTPLAYPQMAWVDSSAQALMKRMTRAVRESLVDKGHYLEAARLADPSDFERRDLEVTFPAGRDALLVPARSGRYAAWMSSKEGAGLAFVPALGIVALAEPERLQDAVIEAIRQEHRRRGRLTDARLQVAAQWFERIELTQLPLEREFHSPDALRRLQARGAEPLLAAVAGEMDVGTRAASGLADPLAALERAAEGAFARSVLVVGAEGSGKTALVHQYVRERRRRGLAAPWQTHAARLIQGLTGDGGGWQHALALLCRELAERDVMLYVGHVAELFEVGQYAGNALSLGDALREPLARGRLMLVAEATPAELARIDLRSPGFAALFQTVELPQLTPQAQERVMLEAVDALAAEHRVTVTREAVAEVLALQRRFSPYSGFPGKGIRFFEALILRARELERTVGRDDALEAFCTETGMPRRMLDARAPLDLAEVDGFFQRRLFGQPDALALVSGLLATTKMGLARAGKPIASLLLIGPTGVGKTETAKALAEFMFGDPRRMVRLDMSEYADPAAVLRLLGDLGGDEGVLVGAVRRQPFGVLLLDEIEKAHPSFFDLLLQVLGEGRLTGGDGQTANFCGSFVVMTSNLGAQAMQRRPMSMTADRDDDPRRHAVHFERAVQDAFRPELYNRIDHIVPFAVLSAAERAPIFARELELLRRREGWLGRTLDASVDAGVADRLAALPGDERYGARDVQRVLRRELVLPLANALAPHAYVAPLAVTIAPGEAVAPDAADAPLSVACEPVPKPPDTAPVTAADALAKGRRHWQQVVAGPMHVALLNQIFRLDKARRRHEAQRRRAPQMPHWDTTPDAARERELHAVRHAGQGIAAEILDLEAQALLVLAGVTEPPSSPRSRHLEGAAAPWERPDGEPEPRRSLPPEGSGPPWEWPGDGPAARPDVAAWRQRFAAFQQRLFHVLRPQSMRCTVGVYASPEWSGVLLDAWCRVVTLAGIACKVQVVRLGDETKHPQPTRAGETKNAPENIESARADQTTETTSQGGGEPRHVDEHRTLGAYQKFPWPQPPSQRDKNIGEIIGFEIEMTGPAVFDYVRGESGAWRLWQGDRKISAFVSVRNVPMSDFDTPPNVHRQFFFDALPHVRVLKQGTLTDEGATWRCEFPDERAWKRVLDQRMEALVNRMLLGEEA